MTLGWSPRNVYWNLAATAADNPITTAVSSARGFASMDELSARYAERSGLDLAPLPRYQAFSRFKLAVIVEGIHSATWWARLSATGSRRSAG